MPYDISSTFGWAPGVIKRMGGMRVDAPLSPEAATPAPPVTTPGPTPGPTPEPDYWYEDIPPGKDAPPYMGDSQFGGSWSRMPPTPASAPVSPTYVSTTPGPSKTPSMPLTRRLPGTKWRGDAAETGYMVPDPEFVKKFGEDVYAPGSFIWSPKPEKKVAASEELWDWDMIPGYEGKRDIYDWMKPSGEFEYGTGASKSPIPGVPIDPRTGKPMILPKVPYGEESEWTWTEAPRPTYDEKTGRWSPVGETPEEKITRDREYAAELESERLYEEELAREAIERAIYLEGRETISDEPFYGEGSSGTGIEREEPYRGGYLEDLPGEWVDRGMVRYKDITVGGSAGSPSLTIGGAGKYIDDTYASRPDRDFRIWDLDPSWVGKGIGGISIPSPSDDPYFVW